MLLLKSLWLLARLWWGWGRIRWLEWQTRRHDPLL